MEVSTLPNTWEPRQPNTSTQGCPICGGVLIPLGSLWRCGRCQFALCLGCCAAELPEEESN